MSDLHEGQIGDEPRELTPRGLVFGGLSGVAFGLALLGIGSTVGWPVTGVAAVAVVCRANFARLRGANGTLEANLARTVATAAASTFLGLGLGLVFAWPWLPLGTSAWIDPTGWATIALGGGLLGVAFAVPWRRLLVDHERLPFPEGFVGAELTTGDSPAPGRGPLLLGVGVGAAVAVVFASPLMTLRASPSFMAAGFYVGWRVALAVTLGSVAAATFSYLVGPVPSQTLVLVSVGAVSGAGIGGFVRALPAWVASRREVAPYRVRFEIGGEGTRIEDMTPRTSRDLALAVRAFFVVVSIVLLASATPACDVVVAVTAVAVAFVAVPFAARAVGQVGTTLLPFVVGGVALAVMVAGGLGSGAVETTTVVVALAAGVAVAVGGDLMQSFAIGSALGATPRRLAMAAAFGVVVTSATAALCLGDRFAAGLYAASRFGGEASADVSSLAVAAAGASFLAALFRLPVIPPAIGLLVPLGASVPLLAGALIRVAADRRGGSAPSRGVRFGAGLFLGEALLTAMIVSALPWIARSGYQGLALDVPAGVTGGLALAVVLFIYHRVALRRAR